jgi:hypothetical protein
VQDAFEVGETEHHTAGQSSFDANLAADEVEQQNHENNHDNDGWGVFYGVIDSKSGPFIALRIDQDTRINTFDLTNSIDDHSIALANFTPQISARYRRYHRFWRRTVSGIGLELQERQAQ